MDDLGRMSDAEVASGVLSERMEELNPYAPLARRLARIRDTIGRTGGLRKGRKEGRQDMSKSLRTALGSLVDAVTTEIDWRMDEFPGLAKANQEAADALAAARSRAMEWRLTPGSSSRSSRSTRTSSAGPTTA